MFRIGINLGDVVVEDGDLLGDGVNVAARLEQFCDPGGVLISGTAYDHLHGKLASPLEFTGEQHVKNISRPVRTYRIRMDGRPARWHLKRSGCANGSPGGRCCGGLAGGSLHMVVAVGAAGRSPWSNAPPCRCRTNRPSPCLPFDSFNSDSEQVHFADGISEDLITDLSKLSGVFVIARNSSWTYKGKPTKVQQVSAELGVRYVLEGSVRRQATR